MEKPQRIAVLRTGHLGDTICAIPAFNAIRDHFPSAQITLVCDVPRGQKVPAREVIEAVGCFDQILEYAPGNYLSSAWQLWRCLREVAPDLLIYLPQERASARSIRSKLRFFRWCGVRSVLGDADIRESGEERLNEPARLLQLLIQSGIPAQSVGYRIPVNEDARIGVLRQLSRLKISDGDPFIAFCGGGKAATQRWPLDRYARVLQKLQEVADIPVVAVGTAAETERYRREMLTHFPDLRFLPEGVTLAELFELLRLATVYVGNDTGPMHVAASVGCPVAVIMSARNLPGVWDPDVAPRLIIRHRTSCENCFLLECVREQHRCMTEIHEGRVIREVSEFVAGLLAGRVDAGHAGV